MNFAGLISTQKRAVIVVILLVCLLGIYAAFQLPTAIFPNTDSPEPDGFIYPSGLKNMKLAGAFYFFSGKV